MSHFLGQASLKTRLKSASLEALNGFLACLEPKSWAKNEKLVKMSTPTNANLGCITPVFYLAATC